MSFLNLIVLRCSDIERTREFYECFGLEFERHRHGKGPEHLGTADGWAIIIELYPATEEHPADRCGIGLGVPDLQKTTELLRTRGFEPGPLTERPWGLTFVVRDPDGRRVEVKREVGADDPEFLEELEKSLADPEPGIPVEDAMRQIRERINDTVDTDDLGR
jgi:catechol 2,3-dioxygenase-like lactoylglutathione lyase family enzyme